MTALLRLLSFVLGLLPEGLMVVICRLLAPVWFDVLRYRRRTILENLRLAFPDMTEPARRRLGRRTCENLLRTLFETFRLPRYQRQGFDRFVRIEGLEHFDAAKKAGKGIFCLASHLGSPDLCVGAVVPHAAPLSLLVKSFPPGFDRFITELREATGLGIIRAGTGPRMIFRALKANETIVAVLDQNSTRSMGVFVDFFGKPACTMAYLASFAISTGAAVVPAETFRDEDGQHVLRVHPAIAVEPRESREATIVHMTGLYTQWVEGVIREHPEQWFWQHKRWRTRPLPTG